MCQGSICKDTTQSRLFVENSLEYNIIAFRAIDRKQEVFMSIEEAARFMKVGRKAIKMALAQSKVKAARHITGKNRGERWFIFYADSKMTYVNEILKENNVP